MFWGIRKNMRRLNIGAGISKIPNFINVDISERADVIIDIGSQPLPFETSSIDLIFSYHTLEHIPNYLYALSEIYRVLRNGGIFLVGLPYVTLTEYHLVNPYHLHDFNEYSFDFFDPKKLKGSAAEKSDVRFYKIFHRFNYMKPFAKFPDFIRSWCRRHLLNVVKNIDFGLVAVKTGGIIPDCKPSELILAFDDCLNSRVQYD